MKKTCAEQSAEQSSEQVFLQKSRRKALLLAGILHLVCLIALLWIPVKNPEITFTPLASMDFSPYDPDGGSAGPTPPEQEAIPSPKETAPTSPKTEEEVKVVESKAETAEQILPKPVKKTKVKPRKEPSPSAPPPSRTIADASAKRGGETGGGSATPAGTGKGGSGGGTGSGNPDVEKAYLAQIVKKLNRYKKYPAIAKSQRLSGTVTVRFTVNAQGQVVNTHMVKGSGFPALDQEAMALVQRVSPFKPIPAGMKKDILHLTVPIRFSVRQS